MSSDILKTLHGDIELPVFMPVGTKGTVKAMPPSILKELQVKIILGNTYHLYLRPGNELVKKLGGLHKFMGWDGPILTDSGGFQVFSLNELRKLTEDGVEFRSHIDGSKHYLTPELSIQIQDDLGADIKMVLDECPPYGADKNYLERSLALTTRWAKRSKQKWQELGSNGHLFAIVQGGMYPDLRERSLDELLEIGFSSYALGGFSVGEPKNEMYEILSSVMEKVKERKINTPIYMMGVGEPEDILFAVKHGVKMFDCVIPTRNARNGGLYTFNGKVSIKQARYTEDPEPLEHGCDCYTCRNFSKAYLRHLYMSGELLSYYLNTLHNLRFFMRFMDMVRTSIKNNDYDHFYADFLNNYNKDNV